MTSVTNGDNIVTINESAFAFCPNITSFTFGSKLETIGGNAFRDCLKLTDIYIGAGAPVLANNSWSDGSTTSYYNTPTITIHVTQ